VLPLQPPAILTVNNLRGPRRWSSRPQRAAHNAPTYPQLQLVPGYTILVLDTKIVLSSLPIVTSLVESLRWPVTVPLQSTVELDGLASNMNFPRRHSQRSRCVRGEPCALPGEESGPTSGKGGALHRPPPSHGKSPPDAPNWHRTDGGQQTHRGKPKPQHHPPRAQLQDLIHLIMHSRKRF